MISELPFKSTIPELGKIIDGIEKAGEKILEVYETDFSTEKKEDDSPITQADIESNKILKEVVFFKLKLIKCCVLFEGYISQRKTVQPALEIWENAEIRERFP